MLLKAVELPRFSRDSATVITKDTMIAFSGMGVPMIVILRSQPLQGRPWSRAKANVCLDPAANTLRLPQMLRAAPMETMAIVPGPLPVAA